MFLENEQDLGIDPTIDLDEPFCWMTFWDGTTQSVTMREYFKGKGIL